MRYVTAAIGAVFIFIAVIAVGFGVTAFLPAGANRPVAVPLGLMTLNGTPSVLVAIVVAPLAALHSFRSTLKRNKGTAQPDQTSDLRPN